MGRKALTIGCMETWDGIFKWSMRNKNKIFIFLVPLMVGVRGLFGLPDTQPADGAGSFATEGKTMTFTAPDGSIFKHNHFNVARDETVKFVQPSADARVLNRILSASPSTIDGRVEANGKLYFAAPGGLIFGDGAVIQARDLQAMGGDIFDGDFLNNRERYPNLTGSVKNDGLIEADRIVLGGKSVTNTGRLSARGGSILIATGAGLEISNTDGSFAVEITEGINASSLMAGDMAGNALLQSGILNASSIELSSSSITHSGEITASHVRFSEFTDISGETGVVKASIVELKPKANRFSTVSLSGNANEISNVNLEGSFNEIKVRSAYSLSVSKSGTDPSEVIAQHGDFRVDNGDLNMEVSFSPVFTSSASSLFLGAKKGSVDSKTFDYLSDFDQVLIFGNNVREEIAKGIDNGLDNLFTLDATSLEFDNLSVGLDAETIFKLEDENPNFDLSGSNQVSKITLSNQSVGSTAPDSDLAGLPGPSLGGSSNQNVVVPDSVPLLSDIVSSQVGGAELSEDQLTAAMNLGLYSDHAYLLQSIPSDEVKLIKFGESSGSRTLFGGDYASVASVGGKAGETVLEKPSEPENNWDTSNELDMTSDVNSDAEEKEGETDEENLPSEGSVKENKPENFIPSTVVVGTKPLAPITRPVFSTQASQMLEQALSPNIMETLKGYSNR